MIELSAGRGNVSDGQNFGIGCLAVAAMAFFVLLILFYWTKALKDIVARKLRNFMGDGAADNYKAGSELDSDSEIGSDSFRTNSFRVRPPLPAGARRACPARRVSLLARLPPRPPSERRARRSGSFKSGSFKQTPFSDGSFKEKPGPLALVAGGGSIKTKN